MTRRLAIWLAGEGWVNKCNRAETVNQRLVCEGRVSEGEWRMRVRNGRRSRVSRCAASPKACGGRRHTIEVR